MLQISYGIHSHSLTITILITIWLGMYLNGSMYISHMWYKKYIVYWAIESILETIINVKYLGHGQAVWCMVFFRILIIFGMFEQLLDIQAMIMDIHVIIVLTLYMIYNRLIYVWISNNIIYYHSRDACVSNSNDHNNNNMMVLLLVPAMLALFFIGYCYNLTICDYSNILFTLYLLYYLYSMVFSLIIVLFDVNHNVSNQYSLYQCIIISNVHRRHLAGMVFIAALFIAAFYIFTVNYINSIQYCIITAFNYITPINIAIAEGHIALKIVLMSNFAVVLLGANFFDYDLQSIQSILSIYQNNSILSFIKFSFNTFIGCC